MALWLALALAVGVLVPLAAPPADAALYGATIRLEASGPSRTDVTVRTGGEVTWENRSGQTLSVTSPDGVLDSGPVPAGGSFHVALSEGGTYAWDTAVGGGTVSVVIEFDGEEADPVAASIPDVAFPPRDPDAMAVHSDLGVEASQARALVAFEDGTTVAEAEDATNLHDVDLVGGLPNLGIVLLEHERPRGSFSRIENVLEDLRAEDAVAWASLDIVNDDQTLPAPSADPFPDTWNWYWDSIATTSTGEGTNWSHEISRSPAAWNLNEAIENAGGPRPATVAVDSGFEAHADLSRLEILELCQPFYEAVTSLTLDGVCSSQRPTDHGNHVAGIIGADHDERDGSGSSTGVTGVDPFGPVYGLSRSMDGHRATSASEQPVFVAYELLLRNMQSGALPDVRVINHSSAFTPDPDAWRTRWAGESCGPDLGDDDQGAGGCYPDTEDGFLAETEQYGGLMRRTVEQFNTALTEPPLFVAAAGNNSNDLCADLSDSCSARRPLQTTAMSSMAWAAAHWDGAAGPNPILVVGSIGVMEAGSSGGSTPKPSTARSAFSNIGGDISAPGLVVSAESSAAEDNSNTGCTDQADHHCFMNGTSQAAPFVAGVAGLLLDWDPDLTTAQLRQRLLDWARADTSDQAAPRVDAYLPLLSLPDAARAVVDVNDPSQDGNQRVTYAPDGSIDQVDETTSTQAGHLTEPDGSVDMRDFRRFRDAWLVACQVTGGPDCPGDIDLDGAADHPKRDLNGDGCVANVAPAAKQDCPSELTGSRFDFNGDGTVSLTPTLVGLRADGTPAAGLGEATAMDDLEVLASQWDDGSDGAQGVAAGELRELLASGDLRLHGDGLEQTGATAAELVIRDPEADETLFQGQLTLGGEPGIATVPTDRDLEISVLAPSDQGSLSYTLEVPEVAAGEDRRVDLCGNLSLDVAPASLRPDDSTATATARIQETCGGDVSGVIVDFVLDPAVTDGASLSANQAVTDANGEATVTINGGTAVNDYEITAAAAVPQGDTGMTVPRTATDRLRVADPYRYEVLARTGGGSDYLSLRDATDLFGPSVNREGEVAFNTRVTGADHGTVVVADGTADPQVPGTATDLVGTGGLDADTFPAGSPQINRDGEVAASFERVESLQQQLSWIHRLHLAGPGSVTEVAAASTDGSAGGDFERVDCPSINNPGDVVFAADLLSGNERVVATPTSSGYDWGLNTGGACPRLADDGTTVTPAVTDTGQTDARGLPILKGHVLVGDSTQSGRVTLAEGGTDGWQSIGTPTIADSGQAVAFVADRGQGMGVWLSLRNGSSQGAWTSPEVVAGGSRANGPELGTGTNGSARYFTDIGSGQDGLTTYGDGRAIGALQMERGADGLDGDRIVVAFLGTPNGAGDGFTDRPGLWTVAVDVTQEDDGSFTTTVRRPVAVVQLGQSLDGAAVEDLSIFDPLARPSSPWGGDDHYLAFNAGTASGDLVVRSRWQGTAGTTNVTTAAVAGITPAPDPLVVDATPAATGGPARGAGTTGATLAAASTSHVVAASAPEPSLEILDGPHVAAVTVSDDEPVAGQPFEVINRSRRLDGTPTWAALDHRFGNDGPADLPTLLEPDEAVGITLPERGSQAFELASPVQSNGATIVSFGVDVQSGPNRPPVVDLGGPYEIADGLELYMRASVSDPDGDWITDYAWDLDGDGAFDDGTDSYVRLDADEVDIQVCGGTCTQDTPYDVALRVDDGNGHVVTATTTVTVSSSQTFTLNVEPTTLQVNPGESGTIYATLDEVSGFAGEVDLEVVGLPDGWTAYDRSGLTPPERASLSIGVPGDEVEDTFDLEVVARSGAIEKRDSFTVSTVFGLIPECRTTFRGTVTDAETGAPLEDVEVRGYRNVETDENGQYQFQMRFREGYTVQEAYLTIDDTDGHYGDRRELLARCPDSEGAQYETHVVDFELEPKGYGGVAGRVVEGLPNPIEDSRPVPTETTIEGAQISWQSYYGTVPLGTSTADGTFSFEESLLVNQLPSDEYRVVAESDGFWPGRKYIDIFPDQTTDAGDFALLEQCTGTVGGGTVIDQDGEPVEGATVEFEGTSDVTDEDGRWFLGVSDKLLRTYNQPKSYQVEANPPDAWNNSGTYSGYARIEACGDVSDGTTIRMDRPEPPEKHYGEVAGQVTGEETGDPMADVRVLLQDCGSYRCFIVDSTATDADGHFDFTDVFVGEDEFRSRGLRVSSRPIGYWEGVKTFVLEKDERQIADLQVLAKQYASASGTIRDVETGDPIDGAEVRVYAYQGSSERIVTGPNGTYAVDQLELSPGNDRKNYRVSASKYDSAADRYVYWRNEAVFTATAGSATTQGLDLLPACEGGTVRGVVVDATTLEPIEGVYISIQDTDGAITDANGQFEVGPVPPDPDNQANSTTVRAYKSGYFSASKDITVFCGSEVTVDFGKPSGGFGTIVGTVTDPDGDPLEGVFVGTSFGRTTTSDANGDYSFDRAPLQTDGSDRDWVVTAVGDDDRASGTVTVSAASDVRRDFVLGGTNEPPSAEDVSESTPAGTSVVVTLQGQDPDGDRLDFMIVDGPDHGQLSGTPPDLTYTPDPGWSGTDSFTYTADDGTEISAVATARIAVEAPNTPPTIDVPATRTSTAGTTSTVDVAAHDRDGDALTLSASGLPGWASFLDDGDGTGRVVLAPSADDIGEAATITVTASDGADSARDTLDVDVVAPDVPNRQPRAALELPTSVPEGQLVVLDGSDSSDPDGDPLTYVWDVGGTTYRGAEVRMPTDDDMVVPVQLTVRDDEGMSALTDGVLDVLNVPPTVTIDAVQVDEQGVEVEGGVTAPVGSPVGLLVSVEDPGAADTHRATIDWGDVLGEPTPVAGGSLAGYHTYDSAGEHQVSIEVCDDDGGCGSATFALTATATPDADGDVQAAPDAGDSARLPLTGAPTLRLLLLALGVLALGILLVLRLERQGVR